MAQRSAGSFLPATGFEELFPGDLEKNTMGCEKAKLFVRETVCEAEGISGGFVLFF